MGQTERELGVQSHLKKNGTPTMGGVIFLIATTVTSLFYIRDYPMIIGTFPDTGIWTDRISG